MKLLSAFGLCIAINIGVILVSPHDFTAFAVDGANFTIENAPVASTPTQTSTVNTAADTPAYFSEQGNALFASGISGLASVRTAQAATTNPKKASILATIDKYTDMLNQMQSTYNSTFQQKISAGAKPVDAQIAALQANEQKHQQIFGTFTIAERREPTAQAVVGRTLFPATGGAGFGGLLTQALKIKSGNITAGSAEANSLNNAPAAATAGKSVGAVINNSETSDCGITKWSIDGCATLFIKKFLLNIAGFLVWLTANMFNEAIKICILNFSKMASDDLYSIWLIVRQIVSLVIVFVGLYLGFMFIIGKDDARFQKYIAWVIIFALFVNFSYPITRTIIDFSNIISLNIYSSIVGPAALDPNTSITSQNTAGALIMNRLGLQGLVASAVNDQTTNANLLGSINSTPGALMALVFILYAAYIFLMLTAIIVMRLIALVVITVISPILLVDSVLPILGEKAKELRKIFFEQIIVGPVFMIMLALTLKFLTVFSTGSAGVAGLASGTGVSTITTFFNILMMTIMLHLMIKAVRKVSGDIGTYATNFAGTVGGFGVGKVMAGTGLLGRQTIGAAAQKVRDSKWVTQNPNNFFARRTYDLSNSLATNSFDMRNSKVVASKASAMGLSKGMGTGQKGGYLASQIARDKDIAARIERKDKDEDREIRYQEDVRSADGRSILHRKGTINDEALRLQNERYTKNRDSVFLTKKQNEALAESAIDKGSKMDIDNYQKLSGKEERATFIRNLKAELDELQKNDKNLSSAKAQSLVRSISDTEGLKKKEDEAFDLQVEDVMYKYEQMSEEKKANFLANQSKDVQRIVRGMIQAKQTAAAASATSTTQRASIPLATIPKATRINNETAQELTLETAQEATQRVASSSSLGNATLETAEQATSRVQGSAPLPTPIIPEDIKQVDIMHFDFRAAANDPSFKGTPSPVMAAKSELEPA